MRVWDAVPAAVGGAPSPAYGDLPGATEHARVCSARMLWRRPNPNRLHCVVCCVQRAVMGMQRSCFTRACMQPPARAYREHAWCFNGARHLGTRCAGRDLPSPSGSAGGAGGLGLGLGRAGGAPAAAASAAAAAAAGAGFSSRALRVMTGHTRSVTGLEVTA